MKKVYNYITGLLIFASLSAIQAVQISDYNHPMVDDNETSSLWNMDSTVTLGATDYEVVIPDQDDNYARANNQLLCYQNGTKGCTLVDSMPGFGKAMQFDGTTCFGAVPGHGNERAQGDQTPLSTYTGEATVKIEVWVWIDSSDPCTTQYIAALAGTWSLYYDKGSGNICWNVNLSDGSSTPNLKVPIATNQWQHITAGCYDGQASLAVLGAGSSTWSLPTGLTVLRIPAYLAIGAASHNGPTSFKGKVDDFKISAPGRTPRTTYSQPLKDDWQTIAFWNMDTSVDGVIPDQDEKNPHRDSDLVLQGFPTLVPSKAGFGNALYLDRNNWSDWGKGSLDKSWRSDYDSFKFEAWIKLEDYRIGQFICEVPGSVPVWRIWVFSDEIRVDLYDTIGLATTVVAPVGQCDSFWQHVTVTYEKTTHLVTIETLTGTYTFAGPSNGLRKSNYQFGLGSANFGNDRYLGGLIDDVRISVPSKAAIPVCGQWGYLACDIDQNCSIDFADLRLLAQNWLK